MSMAYIYINTTSSTFSATEGGEITELGNPYVSCFTDIYYNVSVCPVFCPWFIGRYFNACDARDYQNSMQQYDLSL